MSYDQINDRISYLLDTAARSSKAQTSDIRAELAQYGFGPEAIRQYRRDNDIKAPSDRRYTGDGSERRSRS